MSTPDRSVITTTVDQPNGDTVLLRATKSAEGWTVGDAATTRFGHAASLRDALADYCDDLEGLTKLSGPFGPPILSEVEYARKVFDVE